MGEIFSRIEQLPVAKRRLLELRLRKSTSTQQSRIPRRESVAAVPLSFAQQRLWFFDQLNEGSSLYNVPAALHLKGPLYTDALQRSVQEIVRRHEALRTSFRFANGRPEQVIDQECLASFERIDLRGLPDDQRQARALALAREEAQRPFDLSQCPLLRTTLLQLGDEEHLLLLTMHHIVCDGWSLGVISTELATIYEACVAGRPSPLPDPQIQYADFSEWHREWLQQGVMDAQLPYWTQQLAGMPSLLQLPTDRPRPAVQTFRGATERLMIPRDLSDALASLSRQAGTTLFVTLLAAFKVLLFRYTRQTEIVVGSPVANRTRAEMENLVGFFVNTLVLRTELADNPRFREVLQRVHDVAFEAFAHQDVPFEKLVEAMNPDRDASYSPLVQVMFVLQNAPMEPLRLPGLTMTLLEAKSDTAKFDLTLTVEEHQDGLICSAEYNRDLFHSETVKRMLGQFQTLLQGIVADAEQPIAMLPLLTEPERQQMLLEWHDSGQEHAPERALHELFEARVEQLPDKIAVVCEEQQLTYRELNERANQVAHYLRKVGVGPEVLVGICTERSLEMVVGVLGILKAGGAYVPLDPAYPKERLALILKDSNVSVLLCQQALLPGLPAHDARLICLDADWDDIRREHQENPAGGIRPDSLAYVIYTSGSTGTPKGVMVTQANVIRLFTATAAWYRFTEHDVWSLFHSYAFDVSVWELWGALLYGGRLVIVPYLVSRTPDAFYRLLCREGVTVLSQTPSAFRQLIRAEEAEGVSPELALRLVVFGGEALDLQSLKPWYEKHGDRRPQLVNMYGITETTVHSTYRPLTNDDLIEAPGSMVGVPIPDVQIYLLDENMQPVPDGVPGEIYVGGAGVTRGYLNRPELTAKRFIANPFAQHRPARLYRSGDLARRLSNGDLEYLGRIDQQVKLRGFRIELGEIESALGAHPAVREAVVVVRGETSDDQRLIGYVVSAPGYTPTVSDLRGYLKTKLPAYMLPAVLVILAALPLTPNGKVDRRALPLPDLVQSDHPYIAPRTPVEQTLAELWAEILRVKQIGIQDNFFELGGHSLLATQLISRVREACQVELPLRTLFEAPTVADLGMRIEQRQKEQQGRQTPPLVLAQRVSMADLLTKLDELSSEEVEALLKAETAREEAK